MRGCRATYTERPISRPRACLEGAETILPELVDQLQGPQSAGIKFDEALALQLRPRTGRLPVGCLSVATFRSAITDCQPSSARTATSARPTSTGCSSPCPGPPTARTSLSIPLPVNSRGAASTAVEWPSSPPVRQVRPGRAWTASPIFHSATLESDTAQSAIPRNRAMEAQAVGNSLLADTRLALSEGHCYSLQTALERYASTIDPTLCRRSRLGNPSPPSPAHRHPPPHGPPQLRRPSENHLTTFRR